MRSTTAEKIYAQDERFNVDSAGTDKTATVRIEDWHFDWADYIITMERMHLNKMREMFPKRYQSKPVICLHIPDEYDFMQPELIELLQAKFELVYQREIMG
jgi:predicted protein tyrosine phosphatase